MLQFPKPQKNLWQIIGPSILFVALSLNGGELLLWPNLVAKYSFTILWLIPVILLLQYAVNLEIERYSITTGKNALDGMISLFQGIRPLVVAAIIISLSWPAWISNAGNILSHTLGINQYGAIFSLIMLLLLLIIWNIPKNYEILEKLSRVGLIAVLVMSIYIISQIDNFWQFIITQSTNGQLIPNSSDSWLFISALAFGGVAGVLNLVQSDWVSKRHYGAYGVEKPDSIDYTSTESQKNWKMWWKLIVREHFIVYFIGNMVGIALISLVAAYTLQDAQVTGYAILPYQVDYLNKLGFGLGIVWGLAVSLLFIMAQMTILDAAGRLLSRALNSQKTHARFSQLVGLVGLFILLLTVINPQLNQPVFLLQLSAIASAVIMVFYPPLLLILNRRTLPEYAKPRMINMLGVLGCSLLYFCVIMIATIVQFSV